MSRVILQLHGYCLLLPLLIFAIYLLDCWHIFCSNLYLFHDLFLFSLRSKRKLALTRATESPRLTLTRILICKVICIHIIYISVLLLGNLTHSSLFLTHHSIHNLWENYFLIFMQVIWFFTGKPYFASIDSSPRYYCLCYIWSWASTSSQQDSIFPSRCLHTIHSYFSICPKSDWILNISTFSDLWKKFRGLTVVGRRVVRDILWHLIFSRYCCGLGQCSYAGLFLDR